jgi:hypothetical protein
VTGVTTAVEGQKLKNIVIAVYANPITLTIGPSTGPICQGPHRMLSLTGSLRRRLWRRREMGIMYEKKKAATLTDMMALKAAVLPMLMRETSREIVVLTRIEYRGSFVPRCTCDIIISHLDRRCST